MKKFFAPLREIFGSGAEVVTEL